jgi:hypothetical protein
MKIAAGRDKDTLDIAQHLRRLKAGMPGTGYWPFLRAVHNTLLPFKPRAHWGKNDSARSQQNTNKNIR